MNQRKYTVFATVVQRRAYQVPAEHADDAEELLRGEFDSIRYDIIDEELDDVEVQE